MTATARSGYRRPGCTCELCPVCRAAIKRYDEAYAGRRRERRRERRAEDPEGWRAAHLDELAARRGKQAGTLPGARRYNYVWTGPELEIASRDDLTSRQVAAMLGRTLYAVKTMRDKLRRDPRKQALAGIAREGTGP